MLFLKMRKIFLVTDYNCNNVCISCAKKTEEKGRLSFEQIIEKINIIKPSEKDYIEISGGEPTLREDIIDICKYIKSNYDTNLIILSNGRRFKDKSFSKQIKKTGIDRVMTTFYSPDAHTHDLITGKEGSFSDSIQGLKNLEDISVDISIKTVILKQNYQQLPEFVSFVSDNFPAAWMSLHGLIMRGRAYDNREQIAIRYKDIKPYVEKSLDIAIEKNKNLGIAILPSCVVDPMYWQYLSAGWKKMAREMVYISPEE